MVFLPELSVAVLKMTVSLKKSVRGGRGMDCTAGGGVLLP